MGLEKQWEVKRADQSDSTILLRDSSLHIDAARSSRPIPVSRAKVTVARASITADTPYGTVCTLSEQGMDKLWRVLSDIELQLEEYNAPGTTDLGYDLYMAPEEFQDFVGTLSPTPLAGRVSGGAGVQPISEFHAVKHRGMRFAISLIARMFGGLLLLGSVGFLFAKVFPEFEEDVPMALVFLIPPLSFAMIWSIIKSRGPGYRIQLSPEEIMILRSGQAEGVSIKLSEAAALPVNWIARGNTGRRPAGPALEFLHGNQLKTRIALADPQELWEDKVTEIAEPHFVISRQAWDLLRSMVP